MRQVFYWHRIRSDGSGGEWLPYPERRDEQRGPMVIRDLAAYRNVIDGNVVDGRAAHREFLKRGGYEELGNEKPQPRRPELPAVEPFVKQALEQMGHGD